MNYHVVFDVAQAGYRNWWQFPVFCLGIIVASRLGDAVALRFSRGRRHIPRWYTLSAECFFLLLSLLALLLTFLDYRRLRTALLTDRCHIVTGRVTGFSPAIANGRGTESFVVAGRRFTYSHLEMSAGFNQTRPEGGPIRNGLLVRVTHLNGEIARLEIAKPSR